MEDSESKTAENYENLEQVYVQTLLGQLDEVKTEIEDRNEKIRELDGYIYGDYIENKLDTPVGHDSTPVNWLKRAVEIHRDQFMGRGFTVTSSYDSEDISKYDGDPQEQKRVLIENSKQKDYSEQRQRLIDGIIKDNGGHQLFKELAETSGAVGDSVLKGYYDQKRKKYVLSPIESIENFYAVWSNNNFREAIAFAYLLQENEMTVRSRYKNLPADLPTAPLGSPLAYMEPNPSNYSSGQPMITIIEATGKVKGFKTVKGRIQRCEVGEENEHNVTIVANKVVKLIDDEVKIPNYYILPNKRERRRPWGCSDISDSAININLTYVETLSDWRTLASKVNFPKIKAFNFPNGAEIPKPKSRAVEILPLGEGQDLQLLNMGDANQFDFKAQLDELKEQFVRETGISRVFFDDPSVTLNSNQALMTSIKPTTDKAEAKKQLWEPILVQIFKDAIATLAKVDDSVKEIEVDEEYELKINWPSILQKEDPVYQQMLLNRFNSNTISLQSYLEAQGETKEEADRIRTELQDPVTAAILGKQVSVLSQVVMGTWQPVGNQTTPDQANPQINTQANNQEGTGAVSQPGSGAPPVSAGGALAMQQQNMGA